MRRCGGLGAALVLVLSGAALAAETPTPAPDDRSTTVAVRPSAGPARSTLVLRGLSDCAVIDGHLLFTRYDGRVDNVVVRTSTTAYDYAREKYPYVVRIVVPARARPGPAEVYAEPFCGPPEEYPPSARRTFRITPGLLTVRLSPRRPEAGGRLLVRAGTCDGGTGALTVRVRQGDEVRELTARVDAAGAARVSVPLGVRPGPGEVSLPRAAAECPGSTRPPTVAFRVLGAGVPSDGTTPSPQSSATDVPRSPPGAAVTTPSAGTPSPAASPASGRAGSPGSALLLPLVLAAIAASAVVAVLLRRRGR